MGNGLHWLSLPVWIVVIFLEAVFASYSNFTFCFQRMAGRPCGRREFRQLLRSLREDGEDDSADEPHTIERAREAKVARSSSTDQLSDAKGEAVGPMSWMQLPRFALGSNLQQRLVETAMACRRAAEDVCSSTKAMVNRFLKQKRAVLNELGEAEMLECSRYQVHNGLQQAACFVVLLTGWLIGAVLLRIASMGRNYDSPYQALLLCVTRKYDETPSKISVAFQDKDKGSNVQKEFNSTAKVMQSRLQISLLVKHRQSGEYCFMEFMLPSWLKALDRTTAETTKQVQQAHLGLVPSLTESSRAFGLYIHQVCTDKYSANIKAEKSMQSEMSHGCISHYTCDIHKAALIQSKTLKFVSGHVSALISGALAFGESGCLRLLRQSLEAVLEDKVRVLYGTPPQDGYTVSFRNAVLDAFLPVPKGTVQDIMKSKAKKRVFMQRWIVSFFCNDDIQDTTHVTFWTHHWQVERQHVLRLMRKFLVPALLPAKPPMFFRSKWTGFQQSYEYFGLLATCHGLLLPTIAHYFSQDLPATIAQERSADDAPPLRDGRQESGPDASADPSSEAAFQDGR